MEARPIHLIIAFRLYEIAIDLAAADLGQSQHIGHPCKHAAAFPSPFFSLFNPCGRS
jgi:hypothetical protein